MTRPSPTRSYGGHQPESFERFYLRTIVVNEGCGCAELMIRNFRSESDRDAGGGVLLALVGALVRRVRAMAKR
jgi:cbb3-type cytochrome oxidase cytochrome c subunit